MSSQDRSPPGTWQDPDMRVSEPSEATRLRMRRQAQRDTAPELALRRELHRRGFRYRIHRRPILELRREADVLFSRQKVAVFVDGCWWHGCPDHGTLPRTNTAWWQEKLDRNVSRDRETDRRLAAAGWQVVRIWEHEDSESAADRVAVVLASEPES